MDSTRASNGTGAERWIPYQEDLGSSAGWDCCVVAQES